MAGRRTRLASKPKSENYARNGQATRREAMQREREYWQTFHAAMINGKYLPKARKTSEP
jgi:hypothetical protein